METAQIALQVAANALAVSAGGILEDFLRSRVPPMPSPMQHAMLFAGIGITIAALTSGPVRGVGIGIAAGSITRVLKPRLLTGQTGA